MGDHPWFVAEVDGARQQAAEMGADFVAQDVQFNADLTITTLDTMIGDGVDGIAIVVPDRALGPGPLTTDDAHARRVSDLRIYLRQHHGERDLARLGRLLTRP